MSTSSSNPSTIPSLDTVRADINDERPSTAGMPFYTFTPQLWTASKPASPIGVTILVKSSALISPSQK